MKILQVKSEYVFKYGPSLNLCIVCIFMTTALEKIYICIHIIGLGCLDSSPATSYQLKCFKLAVSMYFSPVGLDQA